MCTKTFSHSKGARENLRLTAKKYRSASNQFRGQNTKVRHRWHGPIGVIVQLCDLGYLPQKLSHGWKEIKHTASLS